MAASETGTRARSPALAPRIKDQAIAIGFDACGIARLSDFGTAPGTALDRFIADGRHGDMDWLPATADRRRHPQALWAEAKSAVIVGQNYGPDSDPLAALSQTDTAIISAYAKGRDYHDVLKGRLKQLAGDVARWSGGDVKVFVDTAPLMEKPLAQLAGVGWQGKHTNLVSRDFGSWLFLGAILTTAELEPDDASGDHCGQCRACLDICPTDAFPAPYQLDARKCLAYWTIEAKGQIPQALRAPMGNRVFGCDDCLAVCPWNKFASRAREQKYQARAETDDPPIAELLALDDATFRKRFAGTPVKRTGRNRVVRNAVIAAGNSANPAHLPALIALAGDDSPLVRGAAAWAIGRLAQPEDLLAIADRALAREHDPEVRDEWHQARSGLRPTTDMT
jgi:epoxyqueuosine reductase